MFDHHVGVCFDDSFASDFALIDSLSRGKVGLTEFQDGMSFPRFRNPAVNGIAAIAYPTLYQRI